MKDVILFDLGNTLVGYCRSSEFPAILVRAIGEAAECLRRRGIAGPPWEEIWRRVGEEDHEAADHRVRPLAGRLLRIFQLDLDPSSDLTVEMCRCFLQPIFARACLYEDTLPTLRSLRSRGFRTAIISNTPWGSPPDLWRQELERLGLAGYVDLVLFCGDVGWRKPARQLFEHALGRLHARPEQCLFVGDDPRWDLVGPRAVGIEAVLIDRRGVVDHAGEKAIRDLHELLDMLDRY